MDSSSVLMGGKAECVGICGGKNLWKLSFQCLGSVSAVGGVTSTQGRGAVERCQQSWECGRVNREGNSGKVRPHQESRLRVMVMNLL